MKAGRAYVVFATDLEAPQGHRGLHRGPRHAGACVGKHEDKLGQRASDTATVHFEDVVVKKENLIAPEVRVASASSRDGEHLNQTCAWHRRHGDGLMQVKGWGHAF